MVLNGDQEKVSGPFMNTLGAEPLPCICAQSLTQSYQNRMDFEM